VSTEAKIPSFRLWLWSNRSHILGTLQPIQKQPHFTVAQDGAGTHRTIQAAVNAFAAMGNNHPARAIIYVKSRIYNEKVNIGQNLHNVMFVADGIDKIVVTGNRNEVQGSTTLGSATFGKHKITYMLPLSKPHQSPQNVASNK